MAAGSLLALLDDIASVLDDVAAMTKVAAKKTAGVLGDDLALNAQQVTGVRASRELPVVWGVAKGSLVNKVILVPAALLLSIFAGWAVTPLLMLGGLYLCFEGCEKLAHRFWHRAAHQTPGDVPSTDAAAPPADEADMLQLEKQKIRGAIRTDFILSAEIIVIALGVVQGQPWMKQLLVLALIGMVMTVGVYGLVAGIVKLDDLGFHLSRKGSALLRKTGRGIVALAPWLMKFLSLAGTVAMFLVGGGIIVHGLPALARLAHQIGEASGAAAGLGGLFLSGLTGVAAGALALAAVTLAQRVLGRAG